MTPHAYPIYEELHEASSEEVISPPAPESPKRLTTLGFGGMRNNSLDAEPSPAYSCRCWRCKSIALPAGDKAQADRILARHVLRMPEGERTAWLREWEVNPNHGIQGMYALTAWMDIEEGKRRAEPAYFAGTFA